MDETKIKVAGFKAVQFSLNFSGYTFKNYLLYLWGLDIWFGNIPFLKVMLLANILVWLILFL